MDAPDGGRVLRQYRFPRLRRAHQPPRPHDRPVHVRVILGEDVLRLILLREDVLEDLVYGRGRGILRGTAPDGSHEDHAARIGTGGGRGRGGGAAGGDQFSTKREISGAGKKTRQVIEELTASLREFRRPRSRYYSRRSPPTSPPTCHPDPRRAS